jgi:hypothetical protein
MTPSPEVEDSKQSDSSSFEVQPPTLKRLPNGSYLLDNVYVLSREKCLLNKGKGPRRDWETEVAVELNGPLNQRDRPFVQVQGPAPTRPPGPWSSYIFGVLTDPDMYVARLQPAMETWLRDTQHTYLYLSDTPQSRLFVEDFEKKHETQFRVHRNITPVLLRQREGEAEVGGAWKNIPALQHLQSEIEIRQSFALSVGWWYPLWYVLIDDDTYLMADPVDRLTTQIIKEQSSAVDAKEQLQNGRGAANTGPGRKGAGSGVSDSAEETVKGTPLRSTRPPDINPIPSFEKVPIYAGHLVLHCSTCKTAAKRFQFVFGGNGIFMNAEAVKQLAAACGSRKAPRFAGDVRLGYCAKLAGIRPIPMVVGTETMFSALGDNRAAIDEGPYPFAFHRLVHASWFHDVRELEMAAPPKHKQVWPCWHDVAQWFLVKKRAKFNGTLYYPHTYDPIMRGRREYHERQKAEMLKRERGKKPRA